MTQRWKKWKFFLLAMVLTVLAVPQSAFAQTGEEKVIVYAQVPANWQNPCVWAWDEEGNNAFAAWPGAEMKETESGWYERNLPVWVNSIIVNANEGALQTEDISIDPAEIWVTVEADGSYDYSYEDPDKEEIPNITVWVKVPADWKSPSLWAWSAPDGTNVFAAWPGEALDAASSGWMKKEVPGWINSVIVNGNEGGVQTSDLSVETGKDVWIVVNGPDEAVIAYEEPSGGVQKNLAVPVIILIIMAAVAVMVILVGRKKKRR